MAGTVLVKEALWRASVLLTDTAPQFNRHDEGDMVRFLDDAQMVIGKYVPAATSRIDTVRFKAGARQSIELIQPADCKPGDGSTPAAPIQGTLLLEIFRNMGTDGLTPGNALRNTPRRILDAMTPNWGTLTKAAPSDFMFDAQFPRAFYVVPGFAAPAWLEIGWTVIPAKTINTGTPGSERYLIAGASTDTIQVSDEHLDDLVDYIVARCNMKPTEWSDANKAAFFSAKFLASLNAKVTVLSGSNPKLQVLPFAPEPVARAA